MTAIRQDIQALRGIAVLSVLLFHANLPFIRGGYLGVDIFFVISGYLITSLICRDIAKQRFSFKQFYTRRALRLFPAAFVVLAISSLLALVLMTPSEQVSYGRQLLGAVTFTSNITHWLQSGYFEDAAELLPLLHTWSLSIEEQYYLVIPCLLVFLPSLGVRLVVLLTITLASFGLYVAMSPDMPGASFYLTPFRAWELGVGSSLALWRFNKPLFYRPGLALVAFLLMLWVLVAPITVGSYQQVFSLLMATVPVAILLSLDNSFWAKWRLTSWLAWVGGFSYSLYLVHWPIFAFLNVVYLGGVGLPRLVVAGALVLSMFSAWLLHRFVEERFRVRTKSDLSGARSLVRSRLYVLGGSAICLLAIAWTMQGRDFGNNDLALVKRPAVGFSKECYAKQSIIDPLCRTDVEPKTLIMGDSFAMHLVPALLEDPQVSLIQFTKSTCPAAFHLGFYEPPRFGRHHAEACLANNHLAVDFAVQQQSLETVIIAAAWIYQFDTAQVLMQTGQDIGLVPNSELLFMQDMRALVSRLRAAGKRVVIVGAPPGQLNDAAKCNVRKKLGLLRMGKGLDCEILESSERERRARSDALLLELQESGIPVFWFYDAFCPNGVCVTEKEGVILYRDFGHLSIEGSRYLGRELNLYDTLLELAR